MRRIREYIASLNHEGAFAKEDGVAERSQTENQAASSEMVPESEQKPTAQDERVVSDPEGAIRYGKTRAA